MCYVSVAHVNVKGKESVTDAPQEESDAEFDIYSPPGKSTNSYILSTLDEYFSHINLSQRNYLKELLHDFHNVTSDLLVFAMLFNMT